MWATATLTKMGNATQGGRSSLVENQTCQCSQPAFIQCHNTTMACSAGERLQVPPLPSTTYNYHCCGFLLLLLLRLPFLLPPSPSAVHWKGPAPSSPHAPPYPLEKELGGVKRKTGNYSAQKGLRKNAASVCLPVCLPVLAGVGARAADCLKASNSPAPR